MAKRKASARKHKPRRKTGRSSPAAARAKKTTAKNAKKKMKKIGARKASPKPAARAASQKKREAGVMAAGLGKARADARSSRPKPAALSRPRRVLPDEEIVIPSAPSTLGYTTKASSAESGHSSFHHKMQEHTDGATLSGGDLDADWNDAYAVGDEAVGGDNPTPDQDVVEEIGRALGVEYEDAEELKGSEKIEERDRHRWEYDPASAEDYQDRNKKQRQ